MNRLPHFLLLFAVVAACTSDESPANNVGTTPNNQGVENSRPNNQSANNTSAGMNIEPGDSFELQVWIEPVEWGLFPDDVDSTQQLLFEDTISEPDAFSVVLPAGVSRLTIVVNGIEHSFDTGGSPRTPVGDHQLVRGIEGGLVFNPGSAEFEFVPTSSESIRITRTSLLPALEPDAAGHVSSDGAGAAFDVFLADYDDTAQDRTAVFDLLRSLHETGGTPVVTDRGLLFLAPGIPGDSPELVGSFNGWAQSPGYQLRQLVPGLFARYMELPEGEQSYKIAYGDSWTKDQANRHIEWDGINTQSVGFFNSLVRPDPSQSRLILWPAVESPELANRREVYVYLPPRYADGAAHPLLIAHDGNESIVRAQFHEVVDAWSADKPAERQPVIAFVALPSQNVRMAEYTFASEGSLGREYADFLAETLHPELERSFNLAAGRASTGLVGASLGGLISFFVLSEHSDVFGYAAGMSSSFFWADSAMLDIISQEGCFDAEFYLDSGSPNDNFVVTQEMRDLLNNQGCRYRYVLDEGGTHEWWKWNERLPGVLDHFAETTQP